MASALFAQHCLSDSVDFSRNRGNASARSGKASLKSSNLHGHPEANTPMPGRTRQTTQIDLSATKLCSPSLRLSPPSPQYAPPLLSSFAVPKQPKPKANPVGRPKLHDQAKSSIVPVRFNAEDRKGVGMAAIFTSLRRYLATRHQDDRALCQVGPTSHCQDGKHGTRDLEAV